MYWTEREASMMIEMLVRRALALAVVGACAFAPPSEASAQQKAGQDGTVHLGEAGTYAACPDGVGYCFTPISPTNPLSISGTFSASLGGFTPSASGARMTPLAVTTSDSSGPLPT